MIAENSEILVALLPSDLSLVISNRMVYLLSIHELGRKYNVFNF